MVLPVKVDVLWDDQGVDDAERMVRYSRWLLARGFGAATAEIAAAELNGLGLFRTPVVAGGIRRSLSTYTNEPPPAVPVQLESVVTVLFGQPISSELLNRLRLGIASRQYNWFLDQVHGTCEWSQVSAVRLSLWVEPEVLVFEYNPVTGELLGGEGGDIHSYPRKHYRIPRS